MNVLTCYVSGDNDIGGDGDLVTEAKLAQVISINFFGKWNI